MIHAMPVMSVSLSLTIVRDTQRVEERTRYNNMKHFGNADQMSADFYTD